MLYPTYINFAKIAVDIFQERILLISGWFHNKFIDVFWPDSLLEFCQIRRAPTRHPPHCVPPRGLSRYRAVKITLICLSKTDLNGLRFVNRRLMLWLFFVNLIYCVPWGCPSLKMGDNDKFIIATIIATHLIYQSLFWRI